MKFIVQPPPATYDFFFLDLDILHGNLFSNLYHSLIVTVQISDKKNTVKIRVLYILSMLLYSYRNHNIYNPEMMVTRYNHLTTV